MSAAIFQFPEKREPHLEGEAICADCGHLWHAVVPVGVARLECPNCLLDSGKMRYPVLRGEAQWQCRCGCMLMRINTDMTYCADCGREQDLP